MNRSGIGLAITSLALAAGVGLTACSHPAPAPTPGPSADPASSPTQDAPAAAPTQDAAAAAAPIAAAPAAQAARPNPAIPDSSLADGRYPVHITAVDAEGGQVTIDVVQFFYGEAATEAARADGSTDLPPPNHHWFRNVNPRLRTLPVAPDAEVWVNGQSPSGETYSHAISWSKLASYGDTRGALFWITTRDGAVAGICQYWMSHE
jgi:hypothetical protein